MPKLTKRFIETITPDTKKTLVFWDETLKGFGVVVLPSGRRTYCIQYRNEDRILKRFKIGVHGQISAEEARLLAKKQLGSVSHGKDPQTLQKKARQDPTMRELANDYLARHAIRKRPKSVKEDKRLIERVFTPELCSQKVKLVSRRTLETLHLSFEKTPYQANRLLALLSKMFTCAIAWGWRDDNPARGIEKYPEEKRDRWLDEEELGRLWCLVPACDGVISRALPSKEDLWDRYYMAAPGRLQPYVMRYKKVERASVLLPLGTTSILKGPVANCLPGFEYFC